MKKWFLHYFDNPSGEFCFEEFASQEEALRFISGCMERAPKSGLNDYHLIEGRELRLKVVEVAKRVLVED